MKILVLFLPFLNARINWLICLFRALNFKVKKDFSSDPGSAMEAIRSLAASESRYETADLTPLFNIAYQEGKRAESQGRLLRVVSFS